MAKSPMPSLAELRQQFECDFAAGELRWRNRTEQDFPLHRRKHWRRFNKREAGRDAFLQSNDRGYLFCVISGRKLFAHRVLLAMWLGVELSSLEEVDHINGIPSDNRIENLRPVAHKENAKNLPRYSNNKTGVVGVEWDKWHKAWIAKIGKDGRQLRLGRHRCFGKAVIARKTAEKELGYHMNHGRAGIRNGT